MDYTTEQFFEYVAGQMAPDGTNMSIDDEKLCYKAMEEYANQQNASLKLELQKQKKLNAELVKCLKEIVPLAEDGYTLHRRNGSHQEFLSEDKDECKRK